MNHLEKSSSREQLQVSLSTVQAFNQTLKIRDFASDNLQFWLKCRGSIAKCSLLLGSKIAPNDDEWFLIKEVLTESFKDFSPEDIIDAFNKLIAGKLNVEADKYGKITPAYMGQVLIAHRAYRNKLVADEIRNKPQVEIKASDEEKKQRRKEFLENCLFKPYDEIKQLGKFNVDLHISLQIWNVFLRSKLVSMTEDQGNEYIKKAKQSLKVDASRDFHAFKPMKTHMEGVRDAIAGNNSDYAKKVMNRARALFMIDYIKGLHDKNRDIRKIAERL